MLPLITFHDIAIPGQALDEHRLTVHFQNYLSYARERRWAVFHEEMAKEQRVLETLADGIGLLSPQSFKVLEGLWGKLTTYRRWIGLQKVPGLVDWIRSGALRRTDSGDPIPDKLVIYCSTAGVMQELYEAFKPEGAVMMYEKTPPAKREAIIRRFVNRRSCRVFLSMTAAAAIAIDLSVANRIVFAEPDWDALTNLAALRRCYRETAHKQIRVFFAGLRGTIDEPIARLFKQKTRQLAEETAGPPDIFAD